MPVETVRWLEMVFGDGMSAEEASSRILEDSRVDDASDDEVESATDDEEAGALSSALAVDEENDDEVEAAATDDEEAGEA
jgi:hypothetical protein